MPYVNRATQNAYQARWIAQRRVEWLIENGPCVDCRSPDDLEVDHVDPAAKVTHRIWSWSATRRQIELAKCVVRCHACHQKKSAGEGGRGERHGRAKLSVDVVHEIRGRYLAGGVTYRELASEFGVGHQAIASVITRRTWKHTE